MKKELKAGDVIKILNYPLDVNIPNQTITKIQGSYFWSENFSGANLEENEYDIVFIS